MDNFISTIIYTASFSFSIIICHVYQKYCFQRDYKELPKHKKYIWLLLIISVPVLISAIRYDVGTDYLSYENIFNRVNSWFIEDAFKRYGNEPLYLVLNKVAFFLFKEPWGIFFLSSLLIHIFTIAGLDYFKKYISMPMALFIFYMYHFNHGLNIIRQMIAVSIVFYSLRYIYQKKVIKYIIFIIIASMFHNTAIICLVFYLIAYLLGKTKNNNYFIKFPYYALTLLSPGIMTLSINLLAKFSIVSQYQKYFLTNSNLGIGFLIHIIPIILPVFIYRKQIIKVNSMFEPMIELSLLNIPFQALGYFINWGSRVALYTNIFYYILPPILVCSLSKKSEKTMIKVYYVMYFIMYYVYKFILSNSGGAYPYNTIF